MLPVSLDCPFLLFLPYSLKLICFVCLRLVYPILPVSRDFPFLIAPSVFSNVYFFCLSSSCVPYVASFSGLFFLLFLLYSLTFIYQKIIRSKDVIISALALIPLVKHIRSFSLLYLYFFDIRILIIPLVSSNSFCTYSLYFNLFKHIIIIEFK